VARLHMFEGSCSLILQRSQLKKKNFETACGKTTYVVSWGRDQQIDGKAIEKREIF
jgi:hypothetical protein